MLSEILTIALLGVAAFVYTMAGFAGGSVFAAILLFAGVPPDQVAFGLLIFNIVSTLSSITRWKVHASRDLLWFLAGSVPAAFVGGLAQIPNQLLRAIMGFAIVGGGVAVILTTASLKVIPVNKAVRLLLGALIGALAGITGIGGGVYLAPVLLLLGAAGPRGTAATTTLFILFNSLSGILARILRAIPPLLSTTALAAIPSVFLAAQIGSYIGSRKLLPPKLRRLIGVVLVSVGLIIIVS